MMFFTIALVVLAVVAIVATIRELTSDGYHRIPTH